MKGPPFPWLVRRACRACKRDFIPALAALKNICFPLYTLFQFICPHHRPASLEGSRAG